MKKSIIAFLLSTMIFSTASATSVDRENVQSLKEAFSLQQHTEGGWFAEIYKSPFTHNGRATAGSIYFLLDRGDISHFHQIDCDEIWYYHAGCGMRIYVLQDDVMREYLLGTNTKKNEQPMVTIPAGAMFAAENIDKENYTFISCATTPAFQYRGFRLIPRAELKKLYPQASEHILQMCKTDVCKSA